MDTLWLQSRPRRDGVGCTGVTIEVTSTVHALTFRLDNSVTGQAVIDFMRPLRQKEHANVSRT